VWNINSSKEFLNYNPLLFLFQMAIKCCICLKAIKTYIPIINALIDKVNITFIPELLFFKFLFVC